MAKPPRFESDDSPLTSNPFRALLDSVPERADEREATTPDSEAKDTPVSAKSATATTLGARLVVRRQKKGQGGKTVTCVEGLSSSDAAALLPRLKRELGCSARLREGVLIAGTREHARVARWLEDAGAKHVALGN